MAAAQSLSLDFIFPLASIRDLPSGLGLEERRVLVGQLTSLLQGFYAHLPLKEAMLGNDPTQLSRLLMNEINPQQSETDFLQRLLSIFLGLRDLHTNFVTPAPYNQMTAFLPFIVGEYFDAGGAPHYVVSNVSPAVQMGEFVPGVEITHWNGTPMGRKVLELGWTTAGANPAARHRQALQSLTIRPLALDLMPQEDWVVLTYVGRSGIEELKYPWLVSRRVPQPGAADADSPTSRGATFQGVDSHALEIQRTRKRLLHPELMEREQMAGISGGQAVVSGTESSFPQNLSFRTIDTTSGRFGYIRIWNFEIEDVEGFVKEVARILGMLPQNGLVIDVRGNPGGTIPAGERILQFFTTRTIQPEPVFFRATDYTRLMAEWFPFLAQWKESLNLTVKTGSIFSQGFPLTTIEEANDIGQIYHGKVIVITDAICYSTCCFFAAGFQDHGIGPILGVDDTTGAGGANVWTQELLRRLWRLSSNSPLLPLPGGANMRVAVRRSTRVGAKAGLPLEGLGVASDCRHQLTLNDLVYENVDLLNKAGQIIASGS